MFNEDNTCTEIRLQRDKEPTERKIFAEPEPNQTTMVYLADQTLGF